MVTRLVLDAIWRNRWTYALLLPLVLLFFYFPAAGVPGILPVSMTTLSLLLVSILVPLVVITTMALRELRHLPVTNRDLWSATWIAGTAATAAFLCATRLVAIGLAALSGASLTLSTESLLLAALYDFTWAGLLVPTFPAMGYLGYLAQTAGRQRTIAVSLAGTAGVLQVLVCVAVPFLVADALPATISEFTPTTTAMLIAGLTISFGALAWTPQHGPFAGARAHVQRAILPGSPTRTRPADHLTGLSRVAAPYFVATLTVTVGASLALAAYGALVGWDPLWFVPQGHDLFDPDDVGERGLTWFVLMPCGVLTMLALWPPWARLLKVLPLSVRQINAVFLLTPIATWTLLWLVGLSLYWLAHGTPPTLRLDLPFGLAGIGALANAGVLRFQGSAAVGWVFASIGGLMPLLLNVGLSEGRGARVAFAVIGAVALCAAAFVNHRTLTQSTSSSRSYRRPPSPFGPAPPPWVKWAG